MKALIVDDQASVHQFLAKAINWQFYGITELVSAYNGREALEQILQQQIELVILDIKMPLMTGLELLQALAVQKLNPKVIILSAYNEFEYARQAMKYGVKDYLLKPIDPEKLGSAIAGLIGEKQAELKSAAERTVAEVLHQKQNTDQTGLHLLEGFFHALGIERYLGAVLKDGRSNSDGFDSQGLHNFQRIQFPNLLMCETVPGEYFLIIPVSASQPGVTLCQNFGRFLQAWNLKNPEARMIVGFSESAETVSQIRQLFQQANQAAQMRFYDEGPCFFYADSLFALKKKDSPCDTIQKNILTCIRLNCAESKLRDDLKQFFHYFRTVKLLPDLVYQACYDLMLLIDSSDAICNGPLPHHDFSLETYRNFTRLDELEAAFSEALVTLTQSTRPGSDKSEARLVQEIKSYMENNYGADLSLNTVAKKFFISKYQICRLFKKATGVNYWDYATRIRMEKALFLLTNTQLKNYEIALKVGYDDICYFSTLFKKYYGRSPKEYRKTIPGTGED